MARNKIVSAVEEMLSGFLDEGGYELYSCEFVKQGRDRFLRVFIDFRFGDEEKKGGGEPRYVGTEDCEKVSRYLSGRLDEAGLIEEKYYLEVSSPGMDRPLIKPEHYARYIGREVEIRLYKGKDGRKNIRGVLSGFSEEPDTRDHLVSVTDGDGREWDLRLAEIARARLAVVL